MEKKKSRKLPVPNRLQGAFGPISFLHVIEPRLDSCNMHERVPFICFTDNLKPVSRL